MTSPYKPLYTAIFERCDYTWEDIDKLIYPKILKEEGYSKEQINIEMEHLRKKDWRKRGFW
jgi:hypothetical protein